MTEKEMFLNSYDREFQLTLTFLNAYPEGNLTFRPHKELQSAQELAWNFVEEERIMIGGALDGDVIFKHNPPPETLEEIKNAHQTIHGQLFERIKASPDDAFDVMITFGSGSEDAKEIRRGDILWLALMDTAHHRGQFSVYIRMAGGKAPSLYVVSGEKEKK